MRARNGRGVTLVELLVVVVIVVLLLALLVPATFSAWDVVRQSQCMGNLNTIWKAAGVWRAENNVVILVSGGGWTGKLLPYLDKQESAFKCPSAPERQPGAASAGGAGGGSPAGGGGGSQRTELAMEFDIYWQEGSYGTYQSGSGVRGALAWTIPVDSHPWVRRTNRGTSILYEIDDEGYTGGENKPPTYDDIKFEVFYDDYGQPHKLKIYLQACTSSPYKKYFYDFKINGTVVLANWVHYIGKELILEGLTILADYGLSQCTYQTVYGDVRNVDPKQFFILDYPKSLANYGDLCVETPDAWYKYFIVWTPEEWDQQFGGPKVGTWQEYQSLRHRGRANVLFCDGHIETLAPGDLAASDSRWWYEGR